ncbi:hypothetical protein AgCh_025502 [Apium graveolens]
MSADLTYVRQTLKLMERYVFAEVPTLASVLKNEICGARDQNKCYAGMNRYQCYAGGAPQLNPNDESSLDIAPGTKFTRTRGRTNCNFGASGCETGDCNGQLKCTGNNGKARNRVAEYAFEKIARQVLRLKTERENLEKVKSVLREKTYDNFWWWGYSFDVVPESFIAVLV